VVALGSHYKASAFAQNVPGYQDIKDFFARPVFVSNGTLPTGTRTRVFVKDFLEGPGNNPLAQHPSGLEKVRGAVGARFTLVFTVTVAATPFQQGILAVSWQPGVLSSSTNVYIRASNSCSATNLPHVRLDLAENTMVQLRVPYCGETEFMRFDQGNPTALQNYGTFAINTILPIPVIAGTAAPTYRVAYSVEDIELYGVTPQSIVTITPQTGISPIEKEVESEAYPYSSAVRAFSRTVRWIGKGIPALSSYTGPTTWFLDRAAGAIRAFGFAKPQILTPSMKVHHYENVGEHNIDLASNTLMVAPFVGNRHRIEPSVGWSDVDEMALKFVLSRYSQVAVGTLKGTLTPGTVFYGSIVGPQALTFRTGTGDVLWNYLPNPAGSTTANAFMPSHLFAFATMFRYWRGTIVYRVTFSKTKMHAGRVHASFTPHVVNASLGATGTGRWGGATVNVSGTSPTGISKIFDLKDSSVFEFEVPFTMSVPFCRITQTIGTFALHVVDPVLAPSIAAPDIPYMIEVRAGDDFELAGFRGPQFAAHNNGTIVEQSGIPTTKSACETSIGECFDSVKQMIMVPHNFNHWLPAADTPQDQLLMPWYFQKIPSALLPANDKTPSACFSPASHLSCYYTYCSGSTDYHAYIRPSNTLSVPSSNDYLHAAVSTFGQDFAKLATGNTVVSSPESSMPVVVYKDAVHARLPSYQRGPRVYTFALNDNIGWDSTEASMGPPVAAGLAILNSLTAPVVFHKLAYRGTQLASSEFSVQFSRCAADDAVLGFYVGPPPFFTPTVNAANKYDPSTPVLNAS